MGLAGVAAGVCEVMKTNAPAAMMPTRPDVIHPRDRPREGRELGRTRDVRWGPRTIDIDILLFDDLVVDEPALTIPHPRMSERSFVVLPLLELDPDPVLADGTRILDLAVDGDGARPYAPPLALP